MTAHTASRHPPLPDRHSLTVVLPFSVPPVGLLPAFESEARLGGLRALLRSARLRTASLSDARDGSFGPRLPHEDWLARQGGAELPLAPLALAFDGGEPGTQSWWQLRPVHIHAARDHLVLTDPALLALSAQESSALFDAARPILQDLSPRLLAPAADRWYVGGEQLEGLGTASPLRAVGRNIDIWMPSGPSARLWRKFQNEVQMLWHEHPVNQAREAEGHPAVNSLWIGGGGALPAGFAGQDAFPWRHIHAAEPALLGLARLAGAQLQAAAMDDAAPAAYDLIWLDALESGYLAGDWGAWADAFEALDAQWLEPLRQGLERGAFGEVRLLLGGEAALIEADCGGGLATLWRKWTGKADLAQLLAPAAAQA
ncbi:MAG: regulator [Candidatus Protistobacter heckmanni]|nr:regulator [Candidatus Protistobacter heckmanni]